MRLGEIIKSKRSQTGLSQKMLGYLAGSKPKTVMDLENGRAIPRDETIWQIGAVLCLTQTQIANCLKIAQHYRNNRDDFQMEYALKLAERTLKIRP